MNKFKIIFMTLIFVISGNVSFAQDGESLEARLAKIDSAMKKAKQSSKETYKAKPNVTQESREVTLVKRIAELQAQQQDFYKSAKGRDVKISTFESKLASLDSKISSVRGNIDKRLADIDSRLASTKDSVDSKLVALNSKITSLQKDDALKSRVAQLEQKLQMLEERSRMMQAEQGVGSENSEAELKATIGKVDMDAQPLYSAAPELNSAADFQPSAYQPVAANYLETTDVPETASKISNFWNCTSPTNGFWGLNDKLADKGIEVGLGLTAVYQANVKGGTSTKEHKGRHTGRYDLEMAVDLEKLAGIKTGSFFVHGWGGWTDAEGIDGTSVGSALGINALAVGNRTMDIVEAFYEGSFFFDNLTIALGKMDFTGTFDASEYADDEGAQFLNAAFVDDPTIPFPAQGLGVVLNWDITDTWYLMGGVIDAQGDSRETGFRTALHKEDYFFYALETGKSIELNSARGALPGNYRLGMWVDGQDKARLTNDKNFRDDIGVYTSCDQMLYKENGDAEDTQGLAGFFRYGWASSKYNEMSKFFSAGVQYQGLIHGRDDDVLGLGYAHGTFSNDASATYTEDYESVWEVYYNAQITPWFAIGPSLQYISNPGGVNTAKDAVVVGLRAAITF